MEGDAFILTGEKQNGNFNPLPPHGGRLLAVLRRFCTTGISIHSLRMEGDAVGWLAEEMLQDFNPLPPHGGRLDFIDTVHHS